MTRLLLVEKGACRAISEGDPDREAEPKASARGVLDQGFGLASGLAAVRRLSARPEAMRFGWIMAGFPGRGERRPEAGARLRGWGEMFWG